MITLSSRLSEAKGACRELDRVMDVSVAPDAHMTVPLPDWLWNLRYSTDRTPPNICDDRMLAASVCESYLYLIQHCTKDEAWRRIKLMRSALRSLTHKDQQ